jgi:hypothetical protein
MSNRHSMSAKQTEQNVRFGEGGVVRDSRSGAAAEKAVPFPCPAFEHLGR